MTDMAGDDRVSAAAPEPDRCHAAGPADRWAERSEEMISAAAEGVAAALLLADITLLAYGVSARYFFHIPVTWVEELASLIFLWFGMLGVVSALHRDAHMRLSFVLSLMPPRVRHHAETVVLLIMFVFLAKLVRPGIELTELNNMLHSPNLGIPGSVAPLGTTISIILMLVILTCRLWRRSTIPAFLGIVALVVALVVALELTPPFMEGLGNLNLVIFFGFGVMGLIIIGVPIAFAFGTASLGYFMLTSELPLNIIVGRINEGMSGFILLTIPLFVLLGLQIQYTGMAKALVDFVAAIIGNARGGLSYVMLCAMYLVSGISGAKAADMAAIAPVLAPAMKERGVREGDIPALLAVSAAAAETIPPSLVLIIIGSVTGISIAALFVGGLLPALVCMLALAAVVFWRSRGEQAGHEQRSLKLIVKAFVVAIPALVLPLLIRVAVLEGVATATEVAVIGIVYVTIFGIIRMRGLSLAAVGEMLVETITMTGAIMIMIALAGAMSWALTQSGFAHALVQAMVHLPGGKASFLAVSIVAFIIFGSILEGIPAIVLFGPLLVPAAQALGIHSVQYAIVVLLSMGLGLFAPPFGYGYYMACAVAKVSPDKAMKNMVPFLAALAFTIIVIAAFPWLSVGLLH
jgi:tripartite ATP-independent transporter DctM subunit